MDKFPETARTSLKRLPKRGVFERESVYAILDEAFICHVSFVTDNGPVVIPTGYGRSGDNLFIHGSAASRMLRTLATKVEVCVTVTILDGLVLARSAFHHSMNYRSVVIFGAASLVKDNEKLQALRVISDNIIPERWEDVREPNEQELRKTLVLRLPLKEASAKVRTGPPLDDEQDYELPIWAGEIPLRLVALNPVPDPRLPSTIDVPDYIRTYAKARNGDVRIRRAEPDDAQVIESVLEKSFVEYRDLYTAEGYAATAITADAVKVRMSQGPMWVAAENEQIVGTVAAISKGQALHVRGMGIVPAARGKRIGQLLLDEVESFARTYHHAQMTLHTTPFLCRAIALYHRFGFERSDEATADLFGTPLFTMVKNL